MTASNSLPRATPGAFLATLAASGVLADPNRQLASELAAAYPDVTGPDLAGQLVSAGLLTAFQADRLLAGKSDGFVLGQYLILEPIGGDAVGRVYKARHRTMDRLVAVKVLAADATRDPARRAAFQTEARDAARLTHPHLVTVLDSNQVGERLYLVLEYVAGHPADALVRKRGPLGVPRACEVARQAALGLEYAHERGTCHGNLSPASLLIGRPGGAGGEPAGGRVEVKVADLGTGRLTAAPHPGGRCDPAAFRAPAPRGTPPSAAGDLYSLGATLHYLLTGHAPAPHAPPALLELQPATPPAVAELVRQLLHPDASQRPSAAEVAATLRPFAEGEGEIDFNLPAGPGQSASPTGASGFLTGFHAATHPQPLGDRLGLDDTFPWSGLAAPGSSPTLELAAPPTAIVTRLARPKSRRPWAKLTALATRLMGG